VLLNDGNVKCWGGGYYGRLGQGTATDIGVSADQMGDNLPTVNLGTGKTTTALAAGYDHTCALLNDVSVKCWGRNDFGQLGQGTSTNIGDLPNQMGDNLPPVDLGTGKTALALAAGGYDACALLNDGHIKCWGANEAGQLGQGDISHRGLAPNQMGDNLSEVQLW